MRYTLIILVSAVINITYTTEQPPATRDMTPPTIHVNNYITSSSHAQQETMVAQTAHFENTISNITTVMQQARDNAHEYSTNMLSWIANNKKKSILYCMLTGYGYIWYKLMRLHYALSKATNWSSWQRTLPLEQLLAQQQAQVAKNLLTAIQRQYSSPQQFDDFISPLVAFVSDVDTELEQLHQLVNLHKWIARLYLAFLFPQQTQLLEQAQENIHRLTFLKNLLLNWVSEHKVARVSNS